MYFLNKLIFEIKEALPRLVVETINGILLMIAPLASGVYFTNFLLNTKTVESFVVKVLDNSPADSFFFFWSVASISFISFYLLVKKFNIKFLVPLSHRLIRTLPQSLMLFGAVISSTCLIPALYLLLNGTLNHEFRFFFLTSIYIWFMFFVISFFMRTVIHDVFDFKELNQSA